MIAKLKGVIDTLSTDHLIIDVNGVCYKVFTSQRLLRNLQEGEAATIYTESLTRQEHTQLFGFGDENDQEWFLRLITIPGVGAKVGLAILSAMTTAEFIEAVSMQDKAMICQADGVGPKLAARVITELKDKLPAVPIGKTNSGSAQTTSQNSSQPFQDAHAALVTLGYQRGNVTQALQQLLDSTESPMPTDELIRRGLALLTSIKVGAANAG